MEESLCIDDDGVCYKEKEELGFNNVIIINDNLESPIYNLNDDCLLHICRYLDIYNLFRFNRVSQRFNEIATEHFKTYKRTCLKLRTLEMEYIDDIFELIVIPNSNYLHISGGNCIDFKLQENLLKHVPKCTRLMELDLIYFRLTVDILNSFQTVFKHLDSLSLNRCDINDSKMLSILDLPNLKKLNLSGNITLTGIHLPKLSSKLIELNLEFCTQLEYEYFVAYIIKNENNLEVLDITFDNSLNNDNFLEIIANFQRNLQKLYIGEIKVTNFLPITKLKKLERFACHQITTFTLKTNLDALLLELCNTHRNLIELDISFCELHFDGQNSLKQFDSLEILKLKRLQIVNGKFEFVTNLNCLKTLQHLDVSYCNLNDNECLEIVKKSPYLKYLNIESNPSTSYGLFSLIFNCNEIIATRKVKLKINARGIKQNPEADLTMFESKENEIHKFVSVDK